MPWAQQVPATGAQKHIRWRGFYRLADGRKRSKTFDHKSAALRWASAQEQRVVEGSRHDPSSGRMRWGVWCEQWWPSRKLEPGAARSQVSLRDNHVLPRWRDVPLNEIEHLDIQTWVNRLAPALAASSAKQAYYQLSSSLKAAVRAGLLDVSPCYGVRLPTLPPAPERYLSDPDLFALFRQFDGCYRVLVEMLLDTGMRLGEAVILHEHRINWSARTIDVIEKWDSYAHVIREYGKGKRRRTVPLTPRLEGILRSWLARRDSNTDCGFTHARGSVCRSSLVLVGPHGAVIDPHNFTNVKWKGALGFARIGHARPHDLRHTYASRLVTAGVSLTRVQKLLGHESIATTERYAHLIDDGHDEVRDALAQHDQVADQGAATPTDLDDVRQSRNRRKRA